MSESNNIISLCGFSGAGKTIIAEAFAKKHPEYAFVDLDAFIEKKYSQSISEIFKSEGEEAFREYEYSALCELVAKPKKLIVALGGGTLELKKTRRLAKDKTLCVYLKCSAEVLAERIAQENERKKRPLLSGVEDIEKWVKKMLSQREKHYLECAADQIDTTEWNELLITESLYRIQSGGTFGR